VNHIVIMRTRSFVQGHVELSTYSPDFSGSRESRPSGQACSNYAAVAEIPTELCRISCASTFVRPWVSFVSRFTARLMSAYILWKDVTVV